MQHAGGRYWIVEESNRVIYAAIAANLLIAAAKFVAAVVTRSSAMMTEGIHSLVDSGDGGLLLLGNHLGRKPADAQHPYGHGREVYFWSFVVAIMIFALGGGISIYEGILRVGNPEPLRSAKWNYIVLGASFVFEASSFVVALRHFLANKHRDVSVYATIRASKNPSDFMVLFEDSAALIGIVIATVAVTLELWTHNPLWDGSASIAIGLLLCVVATLLARETRGLLIGESLLPDTITTIQRMIEADPAVERAARPLSSYLGPETVLVNLEIKFRRNLETGAIEKAIDRIECAIRARFPVVKRVFIAAESLEEKR